jgi:arylsulfatase A-like enzyme
MTDTPNRSRREFIKRTAGTTAGVYAALHAGGGEADAKDSGHSTAAPPFPGRKPNFLFILVDEMRYAPGYESAEIAQWRRDNLRAQERLRDHGLEFRRHYTGATACTPSRNTIFTGHYPSMHGQTQTDGVAKSAFDYNMFWLDPNTLPTMGDYFRGAGYRTFYKGKWHVSEANILIPGSKKALLSYDPDTGRRDPVNEQVYLKADRLDPFGFTGWIGPEPHGSSPHNTGSSAACPDGSTPATCLTGRDVVYADYVVEQFDQLEARGASQAPWAMVASFVNPHDITLFGFFGGNSPNLDFEIDGTVPEIPPSPTDDQSFVGRPTCQLSYKVTYEKSFQPTTSSEQYRQLYYQLQKNVDQQIQRVLDRLMASRFYQDTIVIFTSDHGELLGSHGGIYQKWHNAFEETIRVPFVVHNPRLFPERRTVDMLTSHVDIIPTMLGLAGVNPAPIATALKATHSDVRPLVGRDLSALITGTGTVPRANEPIYFMTDDEPSKGSNQENFTGFAYTSVRQPNHLETVVATVQTPAGPQLWKYTRYFDNPQFWNKPCTSDDVPHLEVFDEADLCDTVRKFVPVPDQYELYNLTADPNETLNFAFGPNQTAESEQVRAIMAATLDDQRAQKRLYPTSGESQGVPACAAATPG